MLKTLCLALVVASVGVIPAAAQEELGARGEQVPSPLAFNPQDRCATPDGRKLIKESWDAATLYDLKIQAESLDRDFVEYLDERVEQFCKPQGGWTFAWNPDPDQVTFNWTGSDRPELFWSSYGEDLNESGEFKLPEGWQVCRFTYNAGYKRKHHVRFDIQPAFWWEGDDENPDRFRGYKFTINLHGDPGNPTNLILRNVQMVAIKSSFTNDERFRRGCDMPDRNTGPAKSPTPKQNPQTPLGPANIRATLFENGEVAELIIRNSGASSGRFTYLVRVLDGDDGKWDVAGEGYLVVPAGDELRIPFHKWRARDWELQSM